MSISIEQKPKYQLLPASSPVIFTVNDGNTIVNKVKVKYVAEIRISNKISGLGTTVAKVKVSPNDTGRGIFDLSPIIQSYVSPDYEGGTVHNTNNINNSEYNTVQWSDTTPHPIHLIDKFSTNRKSCRFLRVVFKVEGAGTITDPISDQGTSVSSLDYVLYNGVLDEEDVLNLDSSGNYGYNLDYANHILNDLQSKFLTNGPTKQYIRDTDYHTVSYFSQYDEDFVVGGSGTTYPSVSKIKIQFYYNGSTTGSLITRNVSASTGGHAGNFGDSNTRLQFAGVGPGNITGAGNTLPTNWDTYSILAFDDNSNPISQLYYFYRMYDDCKGYENIRLTWLNKFGTWDYYNFNKKSVRTYTSDRTTYKQIDGTWNDTTYKIHGYRGGNKVFRNSVSESITLNTDYITEAEAVWLEELFMSTDVYILNPKSTDNADEGYIKKYIEPVTLSTGEHIRKTTSNDKLIQYTFEITKSKNRKIQRV